LTNSDINEFSNPNTRNQNTRAGTKLNSKTNMMRSPTGGASQEYDIPDRDTHMENK